MATGGLALLEPLHDDDARSWFKRFKVCAAANGWDTAKQLLCLPKLLRGRAWEIFDSLGDGDTDTYAHLKEALLLRFSPDTDEDRMVAREKLSMRKFQDGGESIDELACDLERLLDRASPGLPANVRDTELPHQCTARKRSISVETPTEETLKPSQRLGSSVLSTGEQMQQNPISSITSKTQLQPLDWIKWRQHYKVYQNS